MNKTTWSLQTPNTIGAIAIIQLDGDVDTALQTITGINDWKLERMQLIDIPGIDEVIAVKLSKTTAQIMSHGGTQVLREFVTLFDRLHIENVNDQDYMEADNAIEAAMLKVIALAESVDAIELLLSQPQKLRNASPTEEDLQRSNRLNHLISPPKVVLLGEPNTGKSTLMNAFTREETSIVHARPGATRDAVGARVNCNGLVIDMYDLPGFRESTDKIEQEAITIATSIKATADLTLLIADAEHDWIEQASSYTIRVGTKADEKPRADADICVCALTGEGMQELSATIRESLVHKSDIEDDGPWFFAGLESY